LQFGDLYNGLGIMSTLRRHKQGFEGKTEKRNLVFVIIKLRIGGLVDLNTV